MGALAGRQALVRVTGAPVAFATEATTANVARTQYTITDATKNCWDPTAAVVVEVDTGGGFTTADPTTYTLERLVGRVTFLVAQSVGTVVEVSGSYLPLSSAAGAKAWSLKVQAADIDDTDFDGAAATGYKHSLRGLLSAAGTIGAWFRGGNYFLTAIVADTRLVVELFADRAGPFDARAWVSLDSDEFKSAVSANPDETVSWTGMLDADDHCIAFL